MVLPPSGNDAPHPQTVSSTFVTPLRKRFAPTEARARPKDVPSTRAAALRAGEAGEAGGGTALVARLCAALRGS